MPDWPVSAVSRRHECRHQARIRRILRQSCAESRHIFRSGSLRICFYGESGFSNELDTKSGDCRNGCFVCRAGRRVSLKLLLYAPLMNEPPPGVDSQARASSCRSEYKRQAVFYRTSDEPGTIIVNTHDRFRISCRATTAPSATASASAATASSGVASTASPARPNGRTGLRLRR